MIVLLPDTPECLTPTFLSRLISMGIYNFTTNLDGVKYLLDNPNTYRDVAHLHQIDQEPVVQVQQPTQSQNTGEQVIVDNVIKNVDEAIRIRIYRNGEETTYAKRNFLDNEPEANTVPFVDIKNAEGTIEDSSTTDVEFINHFELENPPTKSNYFVIFVSLVILFGGFYIWKVKKV